MDTGVKSGAIGHLKDPFVATLMVIQVRKKHRLDSFNKNYQRLYHFAIL